jgi:hypothetical protein
MALAAVGDLDRLQQTAADIGVERVELDPEPLGGLTRG